MYPFSTFLARLETPVMICTSLSLSISLSLYFIFSTISSISLLSTTFNWALLEHPLAALELYRLVSTHLLIAVLKCPPKKRVPRVEYSSALYPTGCTHCQVKYPVVHTVSLSSYISLLVSLNLEPYEPVLHFQISKGGPHWQKQLTNVDHLQQLLKLIDWLIDKYLTIFLNKYFTYLLCSFLVSFALSSVRFKKSLCALRVCAVLSLSSSTTYIVYHLVYGCVC